MIRTIDTVVWEPGASGASLLADYSTNSDTQSLPAFLRDSFLRDSFLRDTLLHDPFCTTRL